MHKKIIEKSVGNFARDVQKGLSSQPKHISSVYLYDAEGSRVFQDIMDMPEYYLTDCETEILNTYKHEIVRSLGKEPFRLVELGAGDGRKTRILLEYFEKCGLNFEYTPIDISSDAMRRLLSRLGSEFPNLSANGFVCEYQEGLCRLRESKRRNLVLFLGSSIGNFPIEKAEKFCSEIGSILGPGDLFLLGLDKVKDPEILMKAYQDSAGITERFNLNLLLRINNELGGRFDINLFQHCAGYDPLRQTMMSFLLSRKKQSVFIQDIDKEFSFEAWEPIHTEYSWKYSLEGIQNLAEKSGFDPLHFFSDRRKYFVNALLKVKTS